MKIDPKGAIRRSVKKNCGSSRESRHPWKVTSAVLGAMSALVLSGCGAARPMHYYQLSVPANMTQAQPNPSGASLALVPLLSSNIYRDDRIVYSEGPEEMGTYEYQRWTEPPAAMIDEVLLRELRASGHFREVVTQRSASHADFVLRGRLYDFKEVSGSPLLARVTLEWELFDSKSGAMVLSHHYGHDEPVASKDVPAMVAALDRNVQSAVNEMKASLDQYFATASTNE